MHLTDMPEAGNWTEVQLYASTIPGFPQKRSRQSTASLQWTPWAFRCTITQVIKRGSCLPLPPRHAGWLSGCFIGALSMFHMAGLPALHGSEPGQVRKEAATAIFCKCRGSGSPPPY